MYNLLESCSKIKENLVGTNGINYLHNYFLAILNTDKINNIDSNNREIGNINVMTYNECIENIRPYHINKLKIINVLYELVYDYLESNNYNNKVPLKRMGTPKDIVSAVFYLLTDESSYVTGHNLVVDGGWTVV